MLARVRDRDRGTGLRAHGVTGLAEEASGIPTMWFLPRQTPLITLAILAGFIVAFVLDANVIVVVSGAVFAVLLIGVLFDLYEGPKR